MQVVDFPGAEGNDRSVTQVVSAERRDEHPVAVPLQHDGFVEHLAPVCLVPMLRDDERAVLRRYGPAHQT
jgi:hypothetical protein